MTAEIAIMNKEAVALAADSAVTIDTGAGRKIYNTVNKRFALTKYAPVGIMVYGRADLMGIPWESIIKTYRPIIGSKTFGTIREHVSHFTSFLRRHSKQLFPPETQAGYVRHLAGTVFLHIRNQAQDRVQQIIKVKGQASRAEIEAAIDKAVQEHLEFVVSKPVLGGMRHVRPSDLKRRYASKVDAVKSEIFQKLPISGKTTSRLSSIALEICRRRLFGHSDSGVVIAGFGETETFPYLTNLTFGGVAADVLRYEVSREHRIEHNNTAAIIPFAQSEMVVAFMEGIDPRCDHVVKSYWQTIMTQFPDEVANAIPGLATRQRRGLRRKLQKAGDRILDGFRQQLKSYQNEYHISPVIDAVAVLPKDLLAEVAESLVNLTSFKRRISMTSAETVGGPIDVAVISRGDGFIWIKRKHYFKPELNPQFMSQYFGGSYGT